ncbi:MAG: hypothetical protein Kow009_04170 [Spirochaetales bacterium]
MTRMEESDPVEPGQMGKRFDPERTDRFPAQAEAERYVQLLQPCP